MAISINGTTGISGVEGSVSAPVLTGTDSNCGISFPAADTIKFSTGGVERMAITNSGVSIPNHIIQVVSAVKTDTFSTSSTSFTDVTGLSASITPSSSSNKVLFLYTTNYSHKQSYAHFQLVRGSTAIFIGDAASSRGRSTFGAWLPNSSDIEYEANVVSGSFLDSPSTTSSTTYKIQMRVTQNTGYVNRLQGDDDAAYTPRMASSIVLLEVAG